MICVTVKRAENVDLCRSSVTRPLSSPSGGNDKAKEGNQILFVYGSVSLWHSVLHSRECFGNG